MPHLLILQRSKEPGVGIHIAWARKAQVLGCDDIDHHAPCMQSFRLAPYNSHNDEQRLLCYRTNPASCSRMKPFSQVQIFTAICKGCHTEQSAPMRMQNAVSAPDSKSARALENPILPLPFP